MCIALLGEAWDLAPRGLQKYDGREEVGNEEGTDSVCQTSKPVIFLSVHVGSESTNRRLYIR